jgi:hypothetical protein
MVYIYSYIHMYMNSVFDLLLIGCSWAEEEVERSFDDDTGSWKSSAVEAPEGRVRTSLVDPEQEGSVCG